MFSLDIIDRDKFLDLPATTQLLYFHLGMRSDDDGFVGNPKRILRYLNLSCDDLRCLEEQEYITCFDSGVIRINHFQMHNILKKDRYKPTIHGNEFDVIKKLPNKKLAEYGILENIGYIYVIFSEEKICKIGISQNPKVRMSSIKAFEKTRIIKSYVTESCYNSRELESLAHEHFSDKKIKGEWFEIKFDEAVEYVKQLFKEKAKV